jgi:hypothetical protein
MICGLVLSAAMLGHVELGRADGLETVRPMVAVGFSADDLIAWFADRDRFVRTGDPVPVCFLPYGTKAIKLKDVELTRTVRGRNLREAGALVTISDGPLSGATVYIRKMDLHDTQGKPSPSTRLSGMPPPSAKEDTLGGAMGGIPIQAAASAKELGGYIDALRDAYVNKVETDTPVGIIALGNKTKVKVVGEVKIPSRDDEDGRPGLIVHVLNGPALGRNLVVAKIMLGSEREKALAAMRSAKRSDDPGEAEDEAPSTTSSRRTEALAKEAARQKAKRSARARATNAREAAEAEVAYQERLRAESNFKAALPYLVEAEKARLQRMSDAERNAALQRMAAADERIARAIEFKSGVPQYPPYNGNGPMIPQGQVINPFPVP